MVSCFFLLVHAAWECSPTRVNVQGMRTRKQPKKHANNNKDIYKLKIGI